MGAWYPSSRMALWWLVGSGLLWSISSFSAMGTPSSAEQDREDRSGEASCGANSTPVRLVDPKDPLLVGYHFDSISSTQDEAKRIAEDHEGRLGLLEEDLAGASRTIRTFAVTAGEQTKGRGTNGRVWMGRRGNAFVTIGVRQTDWTSLPTRIPLTLLPLKIGSLVAERIQGLLDSCPRKIDVESPSVTLKWPNDVLVNARKISGVLIESTSNGWFLIGIGVNLAYAPTVPSSGPNQGRASTSLSDYCVSSTQDSNEDETLAQRLGMDLAKDLHSFLRQEEEKKAGPTSTPSGREVLEDWKRWIDWDAKLVLRDTPHPEEVQLMDVLPDGRIEVQTVGKGTRRTLVSDYFF